MGILAVLGIIESVAEGIGISLFIPFLASLDQESFAPDDDDWFGSQLAAIFSAIPPSDRFAVISLSIFGLIFLRSVLSYVGSVRAARIDMELEKSLRDRVMGQLLDADMSYLERMRPGDMLNTLDDVIDTVNDTVWTLLGLIVNFSMVLVFATFLMLMSWKMTLFVGVALAIISLIVKLLTLRVETLSKQQLEAEQNLAQRVLEILQGMRTIRSYTGEQRERGRFAQISQRVGNVGFELHKIAGLITPVAQMLAGALLIVVLYAALKDPGNLSMVLVFIFILYRLHPQVLELDDGRNTLVASAPEVEQLVQLLHDSEKRSICTGQVQFDALVDAIRFDNVSFRYSPESPWALTDVTMQIPRGQRMALVGPSGAGKSTLITLLLRFYDPQRGTILVDEIPLVDLDLQSWRQHLAVVSQETHIFYASIRENIGYGRPDAGEEEIIAAARLADAHGFISTLPQGYDTYVGDSGVGLSGGQKQRIALARAIVRRADLLILDEATNALDSLSESVVMDSVRALGSDCTVIAIAHRLSTVMHSDNIVVLEGGCVKEQGPPAELLRNQALFAQLYELQQDSEGQS
jgi:subfamily B ATP-binding cassette protein MsbA